MGCKDRFPIRDNQRGESMLAPDMVSEQLSCREGIFLFGTWYKYCSFRESVNNYQNIVVTKGFRHLSEIYGDVLPGTLRGWQR